MRRERVLFVDDEPVIRRIMRVILSACGLKIVETWSRKVLTRFHSAKYELVILDINASLASMSGIQTCRAIRAESGVPIIVLTAPKNRSYMMEAFEAGADGFVLKPFSPSDLLARVEETLARKNGSGSARLRWSEIAADFQAQERRAQFPNGVPDRAQTRFGVPPGGQDARRGLPAQV